VTNPRIPTRVCPHYVVAVIDNGMGLLGYAAGIKFNVTGLVLLISAGVDSISRRGAAVS